MTSRASFSRGNKFEDWLLQWIVGIQTMPHATNPSSGTKSLCPLEQVWTNLFLEWAHLSCATEEGEKMHHFCESFSIAETHKTHIHTTTASVQTTADYLWSSLPKTRCTLVSREALQLVWSWLAVYRHNPNWFKWHDFVTTSEHVRLHVSYNRFMRSAFCA